MFINYNMKNASIQTTKDVKKSIRGLMPDSIAKCDKWFEIKVGS